jgi:probable O-glycosylation ligase (exosortase A-associated)
MLGLLATYLVVLTGALVAFRKPVYGLLIYVGLSVLRPEALWGWAGDLQNQSRIVGIPVLIGWAYQGFGSWQFGRARAIVISVLLYFLWLLLSAMQAFDPAVSWKVIVEFSKTLLPFLVGVTLIKTEKEARQLLWVIVIAQGYVCLDMNRMYLEQGYNRPFAEGFGGMDNNSFAISVLTTTGGAFGLALSAKTYRSKAIATGAMLLMLHTILLTFSRGAFVSLLAVAVAAIVLMPKRPKYFGAIFVVALIAFRLTGPELSERLATTFAPREERDGSAESRLDLWKDTITVISEEPILGVGPLNWPLVADRFGWPKGKEAHSVWMQTAAELGVPGVTFLILFYGFAVKRLWSVAWARDNTDPQEKVFAVGLILSLIGFVVSAQFVSLQGLEIPFYITMISAIVLKCRSLRESAPAVPAGMPVRTSAAPVAVAGIPRPIAVTNPRAIPAGRPRMQPLRSQSRQKS